MKRKAFTLLELLVVMGIMGMMAVMSVGGYRAMRRGMQEKAVMTNVNQFIRAAYQRAQIDRQPVAVYFWNETLRVSSDDAGNVDVVVGKAVAVRRSGRISGVQGVYLIDEFGDLRFSRLISEDDEEDVNEASKSGGGMYLYRLNGEEGGVRESRSRISETTTAKPFTGEPLLAWSGNGTQENAALKSVEIEAFAYEVLDGSQGKWSAGDAYGFEFADITLPHGYLFGQKYSRSLSKPIDGETMIRFNPAGEGGSGGAGGDRITIYSFAAGSGGGITTKQVGTSTSPKERQGN